MMLSEDEIVHILTGEDFQGTGSDHVFGLSEFKRSKWPGGIVPYTLDASASMILFLTILGLTAQLIGLDLIRLDWIGLVDFVGAGIAQW